MAPKRFYFICGSDDFLVGRVGKERFQVLSQGVTDEFSREILSGFANNVGEVEAAVNRFRESVQTIPLFGGQRLIWLRDVNFLADTVTGRAEGTLKRVQDLQEILAAIDPANVVAIVTAAPVDRRRTFPKWCEKNANFTLVDGGDAEAGNQALAGVLAAEAKSLGAVFAPGAIDMLLARVGANPRLLLEEVRKLATYADGASAERTEGAGMLEERGSGSDPVGICIEEAHVTELTPNVAQGDFFEAADAFFKGDLTWTLSALRRHFFAGGDSRPIITALQNRNRTLLQVRALVDAGELRIGARGLDGLSKAAGGEFSRHFVGATEKSSYNLFSQNAWYVGNLAANAKLPSLRRLIDNQQEFIAAFEEIIRRPNEQEEVLRDLAVRCLALQ